MGNTVYTSVKLPPPYAGLLHLDIKTDNVLLVSHDTHSDVKVGDFGSARRQEDCLSGGKYGTKGYMAPEADKEGQYSHRTEMYSVGVVLYCMLCGELTNDVKDVDDQGEALATAHVQSLCRVCCEVCTQGCKMLHVELMSIRLAHTSAYLSAKLPC